MRIGQLARRLELSPSQILEFLTSQNIETEGGANSRLSDDVVTKIIGHFAPGKLSEPIVEEVVEEPVPAMPVAEEPVAEETTHEATPEGETLPEVIRVSKIELQGLKVLGKIDLPEPKKKVESTSTPQPEDQRPPRREYQKRNDRRDREWQNPLEAKRQQEQREAERKKKEQAEALKEKRTNHYYSKVKSVPTKPVRRVEEQTVVEDIETKTPPKGILGKFFRWLRT
jgi:hypothetical protein